MSTPLPQPYDETPQADWKETVTAWGWQKVDDETWVLEGSCPRCGHHMSHTQTVVVTDTIGARFGTDRLPGKYNGAPEPPAAVYVSCNCSTAHAPHAAGEGCGQADYIPFGRPS